MAWQKLVVIKLKVLLRRSGSRTIVTRIAVDGILLSRIHTHYKEYYLKELLNIGYRSRAREVFFFHIIYFFTMDEILDPFELYLSVRKLQKVGYAI